MRPAGHHAAVRSRVDPRVKEGQAAVWCFSLSLDQRGKKVVESPKALFGQALRFLRVPEPLDFA